MFLTSGTLPKSKFNRTVYIIVGFLLFCISAIWISQRNMQNSAQATLIATDIAFNLSVQILGF